MDRTWLFGSMYCMFSVVEVTSNWLLFEILKE